MISRNKYTVIAVAAALSLVACSDSEGASEQSNTTNTSALAPEESLDTKYMELGEHHVGVTTLSLPNGDGIEVWYPTEVEPTGEVSYDVRDFTPEAVKALLTADIPASFSISATRDAAVESGSYPVILFSHGFSGMRLQSSFLTSHLASWGMIVISPDHASRDLEHALVGQVGDQATAVDDLFSALDIVAADSRFSSVMNMEQIATVGHSAGGGTAMASANDDRIDGYVSMASGSLGTQEGKALPGKPSFFLAGDLDEVVSAAEVTQVAFEAAPSPSVYWLLEGVGHNGFDDFCTFGNGKGIIGVAEASGLGALLEAQPQFKRLGSDGCLPPAVSSDLAFPVIRHAVTAWLVDLFSGGLSDSVVNEVEPGIYEIGVSATAK